MQNIHSVLTPAQLADAVGVSESSVKRWIDDGRITASRTPGGHRRVSVEEAARYIREAGLAVPRPERLGLRDVAAYAKQQELDSGDSEALFGYLTHGQTSAAAGLLQARLLRGASAAELVDGPLAEAMTRVGRLWECSPDGILAEHRATETAIQAVVRLRALLPPVLDGPVAVGCALSDDPYVVPSLAAAAVVEDEGFRAVNLGPHTPMDTLAAGAEAFRARLVWISCSAVEESRGLRRQVRQLIRRLGSLGAVLVVGGAQVDRLGLAREKQVVVGSAMAELRAVARSLTLAGPASPGSAGAEAPPA